jgi:lipopolysaccharide export system protein LptC
VVALKAEELKIRDEDNKRDNMIAQERLRLDSMKAAQTAQANQARVNSQENIAQLRANIARERVAQMSQQAARRTNERKPNAA